MEPPYALITAGQNLHWMEWNVALPRFRDALSPYGQMAIVGLSVTSMPWDRELLPVIAHYSTNQDFQRTDLVAELESRGLFTPTGEAYTKTIGFSQPVDAYIEAFHARNGFSRERMTPEAASEYDRIAYDIIAAHCADDIVRQEIRGHVVWGIPAGA